VLAGGLWLLWQYKNTPPATPRVLSLTYFEGREQHPCFSPDGNQVAFAWSGEREDNDDIYVKLTNSGTALRLTTDPAPDLAPAWSPDSVQIAFVRLWGDQAAIFPTSPLGGPERKLADFRPVPQMSTLFVPSISWSPNGEWLAISEADSAGGNGLSLVPVNRGERRRLISSPQSLLRYHYPAFSPDGSFLAFAACSGERSCDVYVQDLGRDYLARGTPRRLTYQGAVIEGIAWAPDGRSLVYSASPDLGSPYRLWRGPVFGAGRAELLPWAGEWARHPAVSRTGNRLAYSQSTTGTSGIWKFEGGARPTKFFSATRPDGNPQFSPDGKRLTFNANRSGKGSEMWVANHDGTNPALLLEGVGRMRGGMRWSPDSRWIVYDAQQEDGRWDIYRIDAPGGQPHNLTSHPADDNLPSYSRDGNWIYFASNRSGRYEVWRMPAAGGGAFQITDNGGFEALESWDSPLFARPVAGGPERQVLESVSLAVLSFVMAENGIYYIWRPGAGRFGIYELRFLDFSTGKSQTLTKFEAGSSQGLTVSPDRKTILFGFAERVKEDLMLVENFR
jgi:Tol biopolymer transport system component